MTDPEPTGPELAGSASRTGAPDGRQLEQAILALLARRDPSSTICPSEVARALGGPTWRDLMEPVRTAARRLVSAGQVEITQAGDVVDPDRVKGPIRIRRMRASRGKES
jgi:hypothetical protein